MFMCGGCYVCFAVGYFVFGLICLGLLAGCLLVFYCYAFVVNSVGMVYLNSLSGVDILFDILFLGLCWLGL